MQRVIAILLALLVASASLAVAQEQSKPSSTPDGTTDRNETDEPDHPDEPEKEPERPTPSNPDDPEDSDESNDPQVPPGDKTEERDDRDEREDPEEPELKHIEVQTTATGLRNLEIRDVVVLASVTFPSQGTWHQEGSRLTFVSDQGTLVLHDNPTGLVNFVGDGPAEVVFGDVAIKVDGKIARLTSESHSFTFTAKAGSLDGGVASIRDGFKLHANANSYGKDVKPVSQDDWDDREKSYERAQERGHVGAQVSINKAQSNVLLYDDVEVELKVPERKAREGDPIRIQIGANLTEGRTIVVDLDKSMLQSDKLTLRYFDVFETSSGQINREVTFQKASSLDDVLDPTDDEGPEWWIVEDENGIQLLASIDHWSTHAIEITSEVIPGVLVGIVIGTAATAIAAVVMLRPRKE